MTCLVNVIQEVKYIRAFIIFSHKPPAPGKLHETVSICLADALRLALSCILSGVGSSDKFCHHSNYAFTIVPYTLFIRLKDNQLSPHSLSLRHLSKIYMWISIVLLYYQGHNLDIMYVRHLSSFTVSF
jgi:hypothetical protein